VIALLAFVAQAQAEDEMSLPPPDRTFLLSGVRRTKVNPTERLDQEKGGGQFAASLVLTDVAAALAAFAPQGHSARSSSVSLHPFTLADRKVPLVIMVSFTGARRDGQGAQNVTYDVRILRPGGTVHTQRANLVAAHGKTSGRSNGALPAEAMGVIIAEKDPPGAYTVEAVVKDNLTKMEVPLKQRFFVNE
jgi:hypothetical protein